MYVYESAQLLQIVQLVMVQLLINSPKPRADSPTTVDSPTADGSTVADSPTSY